MAGRRLLGQQIPGIAGGSGRWSGHARGRLSAHDVRAVRHSRGPAAAVSLDVGVPAFTEELEMSNELIRTVLAIALFAHGVGHVLFMPIAYSTMHVPDSGRSWLLTNALGVPVAQWIATGVAAVALSLFVASAYGIASQAAWWRTAAVVGAVVSAALIVAFWDGLPTSPAASALLFDGVVLVALLVLRWPTEQIAA
jgi:hypothetical protein